MIDNFLKKDGLSLEKLNALSYHSALGINLKKTILTKTLYFKN